MSAKTFEGKPCIHGHGTTRYDNPGRACVVCHRLDAKRRYVRRAPKPPRHPNRVAAELLGEVTFEGVPCGKAGHTLRWTRNNSCVECSRRDPAELKAYKATYYLRNGDALRAKTARYRREHPEKVRETLRTWATSNREKVTHDRRARRARKRNAPGSHTVAETRLILRLQGGRCAYCSETSGLHLDHATPLVRGGSDSAFNLQWLCAFHNLSKHALTDSEYRAAVGLPPGEPPLRLLFRVALLI